MANTFWLTSLKGATLAIDSVVRATLINMKNQSKYINYFQIILTPLRTVS